MVAAAAAVIFSVDEESQTAAVSACCNRIKAGHFQAKRLAFEIRDVGFTPAGTLATLQHLVCCIHKRATLDPASFAEPCAALSACLVPILPTFKPPDIGTKRDTSKRIDFRQTLLSTCQACFDVALAAAKQQLVGHADTSDEGSSSTTDLSPAQQAAEVSGCLQFLGCLMMHGQLTQRIMVSCVASVAHVASRQLTAQGPAVLDPAYVEGLTRTLLNVGGMLHRSPTLDATTRNSLDMVYDRLSASLQLREQPAAGEEPPYVLEQAIVDDLKRLLQLRSAGWMLGTSQAAANDGEADASDTVSACKCSDGDDPIMHTPVSSIRSAWQAKAAAHSTPSSSWLLSTGRRVSGAGKRLSPPEAAASSPPQLVVDVPTHQAEPATLPLDSLWRLSASNYSSVRDQLVSMDISSVATLEAIADELVEGAIMASGEDTEGVAAGVTPENAVGAGSTQQQQQQQRLHQQQCCDLYVRLVVELLPHMPSFGGSNTDLAAGAAAAAAAEQACSSSSGPSSTSGAPPAPPRSLNFRRLLLQVVQSHFERCLTSMTRAGAAAPAGIGGRNSPFGSGGGTTPLATTPRSASPAPGAASSAFPGQARSGSQGSGSNTPSSAHARSWGDCLPAESAATSLQRARGVTLLLAGLLRHGLLTPRITLHCVAALLDAAAAGSCGAVECVCQLLASVTPLLEQMGRADTTAQLGQHFSRLERMYYGTALTGVAREQVQQLLDARSSGWKR